MYLGNAGVYPHFAQSTIDSISAIAYRESPEILLVDLSRDRVKNIYNGYSKYKLDTGQIAKPHSQAIFANNTLLDHVTQFPSANV